MTVNEIVDERTRFELYYPPFAGAVAAGVGSVMCSYNKITPGDSSTTNWSCENPVTLRHDLKQSLNFSGFVMSDWTATHSTSLPAGLDMEVSGSAFVPIVYTQRCSSTTHAHAPTHGHT